MISEKQPFINIHSHLPRQQGERNVFSLDARLLQQEIPPHDYLSCGIHPWYITPDWENKLKELKIFWQREETLLIGECGLDPNASLPLSVQEEVFLRQAEWAVRHDRPMLIHCVKAFDPLIRIYKQLRPQAAWILHGFRGKPQQLQSLLHVGFQVSFGKYFHPESVAACPRERFFIETDDRQVPIAEIYRQIAQIRQMDVNDLQEEQAENLKRLQEKQTVRPNH